eukprot:TRINITY_DN12496_c0_g2_i1.p1 TRINITY_DN12496_c0_g2~~TRINITY_DN12496_c0_g2_i1.p1  ORF type:complete len:441 (+),score=137.01 TRINITY_DN12496_c0_g2_i1:365-1687(+)
MLQLHQTVTFTMDCSPPKRWKSHNPEADEAGFFPQPAPLQRQRSQLRASSTSATPPRTTKPAAATPVSSSDSLLSRCLHADALVTREDSGVLSGCEGKLSPSGSLASLEALHLSASASSPDGYEYIAAPVLHSILGFNSQAVLLLDCRTALAYDRTRIADAVSVQFSALMLRRLKKQANVKVRVDHLQISDRKAIERRKQQDILVVVYDEESQRVEPLSPAGVLIRILSDEGIRPVFLTGGVAGYRRQFPSDLGSPRGKATTRKPLHPVLKAASRPKPQLHLPSTVISEYLMLGNQVQGGNVAFLQQHHITHVINVTETPFDQAVIDNVKCMQIPLIDSGCHDLLSVVPEALRFIEKARRQGGRALVYCSTGCSRAAAIVLAYLMATQRFSYVTAVAELQRRRPQAKPNASFMQQLLDFQTLLNKSAQAQAVNRRLDTAV